MDNSAGSDRHEKNTRTHTHARWHSLKVIKRSRKVTWDWKLKLTQLRLIMSGWGKRNRWPEAQYIHRLQIGKHVSSLSCLLSLAQALNMTDDDSLCFSVSQSLALKVTKDTNVQNEIVLIVKIQKYS